MRSVLFFAAAASLCFAAEVTVTPGSSLAAAVAAHPGNTTFKLAPGIHRGQSVVPKAGNVFDGAGAILNGSIELRGFAQAGAVWVLSRPAPEPWFPKFDCDGVHLRCNYPQELFVDGVRQEHVDAAAKVGPGKWFYEYGAAGKITMGTNPGGRLVELSQTFQAFSGSAANVTIRNLTIEKYANVAQYGAIHAIVGNAFNNGAKPSPCPAADQSSGWIVDNVVVQNNHGSGIRFGSRMTVRRSKILNNGQIGYNGCGLTGPVLEDSEVAGNGAAGFDWGFEGGASKLLHTIDAVIRRNHVHDNLGAGIWGDYDNRNMLIDGNLVERNQQNGIFDECNFGTRISNNTVRYNAPFQKLWLWGAQIQSACTQDSVIEGNIVVVSATGGNAITIIQQDRYGHFSRNNRVRGNNVTYLGAAGSTGAVSDWSGANVYAAGNVFEANKYHTANVNGNFWTWAAGLMNWAKWRAAGQDAGGTVDTNLTILGPGSIVTPPPDPDPDPEPAPLAIALESPASGSTAAAVIQVRAAVTGDVAGVTIRVDGRWSIDIAAAPWTATLEAGRLGPGAHVVTAIARGRTGATVTSAPAFFIVPEPAVLTIP